MFRNSFQVFGKLSKPLETVKRDDKISGKFEITSEESYISKDKKYTRRVPFIIYTNVEGHLNILKDVKVGTYMGVNGYFSHNESLDGDGNTVFKKYFNVDFGERNLFIFEKSVDSFNLEEVE